jgi:Protein of unknown function (DUF559)
VRQGLLTKGQLRSRCWQRLFRDVYVGRHQNGTLPHDLLCRAAMLALPRTGAAISGASAAYLVGADVLPRNAPVEITIPRRSCLSRQAGLSLHYSGLCPSDVVALRGIAVTTPVRTAFDLARWYPLDDAVVGIDALLTHCDLSVEAVRAYAETGTRLRLHGAARLDDALSLVETGAESPMETRLRLLLVRAGLPVPVLQQRVYDERGEVLARLDIAYIDHMVGIEYDGGHHRDTFQRDLQRQNILHSLGWTILRFTAEDVLRRSPRTVAHVGSVLSARSAQR